MQAQRPGKHTVAKTVLHDLIWRRAAHTGDTADALNPVFHILWCVAYHRRFPSGTGRRVDALQLLGLHRKQPIRIIVPEILFRRHRQILQIRQRLNVFRSDADGVHFRTVRRHPFISPGNLLLQPVNLNLLNLFS